MDLNIKSQDENMNLQYKFKGQKIKEFKEYLVKSDLLLVYIKFMLSLRQMKEKPKDPLQAFQEFFQTYRNQNWVEFEQMQYDLQETQKENQQLTEQIVKLQQDIIQKKDEIEQEKIRKQEEEELLKNNKENKKGTLKK